MENFKVVSKVLAAFLVGLLVQSYAGAATVSNIFQLNMDGTVTGVTYSGDSGSVSVPVTVGADEYGNYPDLSTTAGVMYTNGKSSGPDALDEVMLVHVGPGYDLEQSYIFESWVMPDYANLPTAVDNRHGQIWIFKWWEIGDWCNVAGTITDNVGLAVGSNGYMQRVQAGNGDMFYNSIGDPNEALSSEVFSHVAMVWTWNSTTSTGKLDYYVNGQLKQSGGGILASARGLPEVFGIANHCFTAMDNPTEVGCGANVNFNGGFSGWFDSVAVSTFTGEFEGAHNFVLVNPQFCGDIGTQFAIADINKDCIVDLSDFSLIALDWLYDGYAQ